MSDITGTQGDKRKSVRPGAVRKPRKGSGNYLERNQDLDGGGVHGWNQGSLLKSRVPEKKQRKIKANYILSSKVTNEDQHLEL